MQGRQVALTVRPVEQTRQPCALPVEHVDRALARLDEEMIGVQVGMAEAGAVKACQGDAEVVGDTPTPRGCLLVTEDGSQLRPDDLAHEEEGPPLAILAGSQPFGTTDAFALERLQRPSLAHRPRDEAEAGQGVGQSRPPADTMLAFEEGDPAPRPRAELDASHIAIRVAADNVRRFSRQSQEMLRLNQTVLAEQRTVARRDFEDTALRGARQPRTQATSRPRTRQLASNGRAEGIRFIGQALFVDLSGPEA